MNEVAQGGARVVLDKRALEAVERNWRVFQDIAREQVIYGVNTGLGALSTMRVRPKDASEMQHDFLRSHAAGVGVALSAEVVRAALLVRLNCLLRARSGVRPVVLERLAEFLNRDLVPHVPSIGSLGASGDLAPSAHLFLPLLGEGEFVALGGTRRSAMEVLAEEGMAPLNLVSREGIALINGTHFMAGLGALVQGRAERLLDSADAAAALTLEALCGFADPFDPRVAALRPLAGQARSAEIVRVLVEGSERLGTRTEGVQDAYSLRCVPQVHGASREALAFFSRIVDADLNAPIDNPVIFDDPPEALSTGNFHGQSLSLAFDVLRIALADLASISERRTFRLLSPSLNGNLPPFLTDHEGECHGYMVTQYTAAALVAELRVLAHPVSVDNVPTSDNQEDHVSMGMSAALFALETCDRAEIVIAIEALCAAQGLETGNGRLGAGSRRLHALIRECVPPLDRDRPPASDISLVGALVAEGRLAEIVAALCSAEEGASA